jgi:anti-anti-sigma factor
MGVEFDIHTKSILEQVERTKSKELCIDVVNVKFMGSQYLGALAAVAGEARRLGAALTVKAAGRVGQVLRQAGLDRVMGLEIS